jgi:hypothetical protein
MLGNPRDSTLFQGNPIIVKASESLTVRLIKERVAYDWIIKSPENEDDRALQTRIILCFLGVIICIVLILPNSFFDRKGMFDR